MGGGGVEAFDFFLAGFVIGGERGGGAATAGALESAGGGEEAVYVYELAVGAGAGGINEGTIHKKRHTWGDGSVPGGRRKWRGGSVCAGDLGGRERGVRGRGRGAWGGAVV